MTHDADMKQKWLERAANGLRTNQTRGEVRLGSLLSDASISFSPQVVIDNFIVDFLVRGILVVEVDGRSHTSPNQAAKDAERDRLLRKWGYRVVRVTNVEVWRSPATVFLRIQEALTAKGARIKKSPLQIASSTRKSLDARVVIRRRIAGRAD